MNLFFNAAGSRLTLAIALVLTIGTATAQTAATGAQTKVAGAVPGADPAMVKFLGAQDDMLVFNVSYSNPQGKRLVVLIMDERGNRLYQDMFRDKSFFRQFKVPKTDKDLITFVFRDGQDAPVEKRFAVNIDSHFVQEVAIKKL
jgi:hypothetical protein